MLRDKDDTDRGNFGNPRRSENEGVIQSRPCRVDGEVWRWVGTSLIIVEFRSRLE